jgi:hypothetical protein
VQKSIKSSEESLINDAQIIERPLVTLEKQIPMNPGRRALPVRHFVLPHRHRIDEGEERIGCHRRTNIKLHSTVFTNETHPERGRWGLGHHFQVAFLETGRCCLEGADLLQVGGGLHGRRIDDQHAVLPLVCRKVGQSETGR